jgi:hypothetical protein
LVNLHYYFDIDCKALLKVRFKFSACTIIVKKFFFKEIKNDFGCDKKKGSSFLQRFCLIWSLKNAAFSMTTMPPWKNVILVLKNGRFLFLFECDSLTTTRPHCIVHVAVSHFVSYYYAMTKKYNVRDKNTVHIT